MIQRILVAIVSRAFGAKILGAMVGLNKALEGKRTELLIALQACLYLLKHSTVLPPEAHPLIDELQLVLLGALPITMADKTKKAIAIADKILPRLPGEPEAK